MYRFNITEKEEKVLTEAVSGKPFSKMKGQASASFGSGIIKLLRYDLDSEATLISDLFGFGFDEYVDKPISNSGAAKIITPEAMNQAISIVALAGAKTLLKKANYTLLLDEHGGFFIDSITSEVKAKKSEHLKRFREELAGHALQGILANPKLEKEIADYKSWIHHIVWAFADGVINSSGQLDDHV